MRYSNKEIAWPLLCLLLLPFFTLQDSLADAESPNTVIVVENDWPPYYFGNSPGSEPGFVRELLDICIPKSGLQPVYEFLPVKRMYSYIQNGQIDVAIFSQNKEREAFVTYGKEPLFVSGYRPVVLASSNITINSLKDFDKLRLGHLAGLKYSADFFEYVQKRQAEGSLITTTMGEAPLRMLLEDIVDVFVDTSDTILWRAKKAGVYDQIKILDFDIKTSTYYVTISKKSPRIASPEKFLDSLDSCIKNLKDTGNYNKIATEYGLR
ncbi:MAG: transporter substrate-binding domain-containing protein [Proteobacteria bacterium]|nr:transporter substrate-binding domain-containing protein [Pseudomonadota bacterium]